jgi:uroporphyrinogen decarboxylase
MSDLWEPNFDRLLTVLRREGEPDRVPFCELIIDMGVGEVVLGKPIPTEPNDEQRRCRIDFFRTLGYDFVPAGHTFGFPRDPSLGRATADTSTQRSRGQRGWREESRGIIGSWEDFERYPWPEVEQASFEDIERFEPLLPAGMKLVSLLPGGVLENLVDLLGYEPLCFALVEQPDLVKAVADRLGQGEVDLFQRLAQYDFIGAMWINDDLGFKTQTMVSPQALREYVFPWHKKMVEVAHAAGKPVMLHACGNLGEVMEDIIDDVHIDAKHSFEDVIQPVADFKRQYGNRIAALGGIDVDRLTRDSEENLRRHVRQVIEECAPGGGWALGSGNSIANYIPDRNYLAMLDEGRKCGVYGN